MDIIISIFKPIVTIAFWLFFVLFIYTLIKAGIDFNPNDPILTKMTDEEVEAWKKREERRKKRWF